MRLDVLLAGSHRVGGHPLIGGLDGVAGRGTSDPVDYSDPAAVGGPCPVGEPAGDGFEDQAFRDGRGARGAGEQDAQVNPYRLSLGS